MADDPKIREFVAKVHRHVIHYGNSTRFYADNMTNT
jgi:Ca-activated chloride channel family protein